MEISGKTICPETWPSWPVSDQCLSEWSMSAKLVNNSQAMVNYSASLPVEIPITRLNHGELKIIICSLVSVRMSVWMAITLLFIWVQSGKGGPKGVFVYSCMAEGELEKGQVRLNQSILSLKSLSEHWINVTKSQIFIPSASSVHNKSP